MNFQDSNRPALSVFILALILLLIIAFAMGGGATCQAALGFVILGGGAWAMLQVGRWAWSQFRSREPFDPIR